MIFLDMILKAQIKKEKIKNKWDDMKLKTCALQKKQQNEKVVYRMSEKKFVNDMTDKGYHTYSGLLSHILQTCSNQ